MNQAEKYYQQYKTDPRARNFINADEYVAMHLSLESKGMVSAWLRDNAAGTLSTQSAEGLNRRLGNKQSYDEWAKYNTGWRGFFKDQISIAKAEAYGAKGGLSIATNTFTFHLSDKWHLTNSQQYQGADFTASRVFATVSREAFIFAATAGTAQLARGGVEGLSISARVINTLAQSEHAVQAAGVVTKGLAAADLAKGTYEAGGGIHEVIKNPTDYHGYLDTGLGTLQVFGGTQSLRELGAATKAASNVGKVTEAVGQEAKQVEKAAVAVSKEAGSGEKAVAAAAHESGQAAKETGDATKEVSHATHELSQADKAVAATSKEGTGAANAARQAEKNVAGPADQAVAESKEVASHTARQSEKALGEVKEAATTEQGVAKAEQTATEAVKHNVGVGAQQEEAAAHVAQAGGQAASKTEQTVTKTVKEGEGVVEQIEKETVQSAKQAERAAAERAGATTQGERSAGRAAEETTKNVKKAGLPAEESRPTEDELAMQRMEGEGGSQPQGRSAGAAGGGIGASGKQLSLFPEEPVARIAPTGVQANKAAGDAVRDQIAAREAPALIEQTRNTVGGARRIDVLKLGEDPAAARQTTAIESKVGRTGLGERERQELARDWWLRRQGKVGRVRWEFSPSDVTGEGGPTGPLLRMLQKLGFDVRINP